MWEHGWALGILLGLVLRSLPRRRRPRGGRRGGWDLQVRAAFSLGRRCRCDAVAGRDDEEE